MKTRSHHVGYCIIVRISVQVYFCEPGKCSRVWSLSSGPLSPGPFCILAGRAIGALPGSAAGGVPGFLSVISGESSSGETIPDETVEPGATANSRASDGLEK